MNPATISNIAFLFRRVDPRSISDRAASNNSEPEMGHVTWHPTTNHSGPPQLKTTLQRISKP